MSSELRDPQPTNEARLLDASELHDMDGWIEVAYQAFRNDEEGWVGGLIAVTEDIAPTLHDALLLTRAALAASEQRAGEAEAHVKDAATLIASIKEWAEALAPADGIKYGAYWPLFAVNEFLAAHPTQGAPAMPSDAAAEVARLRGWLEKIRDYEAGEDEEARSFHVLEPDKVGYCYGLADRALSGSPAAPPVTMDATSTDAGLREALKAVQWSVLVGYGLPGCPICGHDCGERHADDCVIGRALSSAPPAQRDAGGDEEEATMKASIYVGGERKELFRQRDEFVRLLDQKDAELKAAEAVQREYEGRFVTARAHLWNARADLVNGATVEEVIAQITAHLKDIESDRFRDALTSPAAGAGCGESEETKADG